MSPWAATSSTCGASAATSAGDAPAAQRTSASKSVAPGGGEDALVSAVRGTPAVGGAAHRAERRAADGVAAALVAHLPAVAADPVQPAGAVPPDRHAAGARAHHDARSVVEGRRERDLDVRRSPSPSGEVLGAESLPQLVPLGLASGARGAHDEHVALSRPAPASAWRTTSAMTVAEASARPGRTAAPAPSARASIVSPSRHADGGLGASDVGADQIARHRSLTRDRVPVSSGSGR